MRATAALVANAGSEEDDGKIEWVLVSVCQFMNVSRLQGSNAAPG